MIDSEAIQMTDVDFVDHVALVAFWPRTPEAATAITYALPAHVIGPTRAQESTGVRRAYAILNIAIEISGS